MKFRQRIPWPDNWSNQLIAKTGQPPTAPQQNKSIHVSFVTFARANVLFYLLQFTAEVAVSLRELWHALEIARSQLSPWSPYSLCLYWNIQASYQYKQWKRCLQRGFKLSPHNHYHLIFKSLEILSRLSSHSSHISDAGHIMTVLFTILPSAVPNQIIFHVLSSDKNSYNSLNTNLAGQLTYIILLNIPKSSR